ncbi:hypothetical protein IAD21_05476 [Abditibacteriota bacterium]|nr:hypothetical protein IAD21_05476 [Abditibacteriota bacterium]
MKKLTLSLGAVMLVSGCTVTETATRSANVPTKTRAAITSAKPVETSAPNALSKIRSRDSRFEATATRLRNSTLYGSIEVRDLNSGRVVASWSNLDGLTELSFSPDDRLLVVNSLGRLSVWNWKQRRRIYTHKFNTDYIHSAFSPDGKQLAVTFGNLMVLDVASWKSQRFTQLVEPAFVEGVTWSPNGRFLALSQSDIGAFSLVELRSGRVRSLKGIDAQSEPIFSSDSRWLAGATGNAGTFIWKVKNATFESVGGDYNHPLIPIAFSKDARFLACGDENARVGVWRTQDGKRIVAPQMKHIALQVLFEQAQKASGAMRF